MTALAGRHVEPGALVRRLDGEMDAAERAGVESHLAGCAECRAAEERLTAAAARVTLWLEHADPPARPPADRTGEGRTIRLPARPAWRPWESPLIRAAAVVVLLAGAAVAVPSALRWLDQRGEVAVDEPREPTPDAPRVEGPGDGLSVSFVPAGDRLVVRLAEAQAAGRVRLEPIAGREVHGEVLEGTGAEELIVLPDGLSIRNGSASTASYRIRVPAQIIVLELMVGDRPAWSGSAASLPLEVSAAD